MTRLFALVLLLLGALPQSGKPTADQVLRRMEQAFGDIRDLTVTVDVVVNMENMRVPPSSAELYYKRPGKVHVSSRSFALVPRDGISPDPAALRERYDATMEGQDTLDGRKVWKLQLAAKDPKVRLRQAFIWVDPVSWTLARLATMPYDGRTLALNFDYGLIEGGHWLPRHLTVSLGTTGPETDIVFRIPPGAPNPAPQIEEMQRSLRSGPILFTYRNYRLNTGLSDSLFQEQSPPR